MPPVKQLVPPPGLQTELERLATIVFKPKGTILFRRGDSVSGMFLIRNGQVSLTLDCKNPAYPARTLGPGAIAGLPATVSGNPYSLTAKTVEDSELAFVPRDVALACLHKHPLLCFQVMDMLGGEISDIRSAFKERGSSRGAKAFCSVP
jgi:CRP/FNR family transcriptional regulator